ncbi:uncharacterized protein I206_102494 [Kwoniella pini CBS 10737]|uniref:Protein kinase domain-containing protein n=1 Tax=Kwoniella pini CBS 10737 TaxID=1296096 RepID=A0A1B9I5J2_9TREE|nr:uncharacterized protein I206_02845 [Kwoniella pini CBS 10737]OCF50789.1 hypothetical protein I206_02845 [Kwoniella pini CBS 10737]
MAFELQYRPGQERRGRQRIRTGTKFTLHPDSAFRPASVSTISSPPTLAQSDKTSMPSTLPITPLDPIDTSQIDSTSVTPSKLQERLLTTQFNQSQLRGPSHSLSPLLEDIKLTEHSPPLRSEGDPPPSNARSPAQYTTSLESQFVPLVLEEYLASGSLWDFWIAQHPIYGKVVLKIVYAAEPPGMDPNYDNFVDPFDVINHALKEDDNYMRTLKDLQGTIVPRYYGLWESEYTGPLHESLYLAMIMEYAGESLGPGYFEANKEWETKIYDAYKTLHLQGSLLQRDLNSSRLLYDKSLNSIRIVGFRYALPVDLKIDSDVFLLVWEAYYVRINCGHYQLEEVVR